MNDRLKTIVDLEYSSIIRLTFWLIWLLLPIQSPIIFNLLTKSLLFLILVLIQLNISFQLDTIPSSKSYHHNVDDVYDFNNYDSLQNLIT